MLNVGIKIGFRASSPEIINANVIGNVCETFKRKNGHFLKQNSPQIRDLQAVLVIGCSPEQNRTAIKCLGNIYSIR